MGAALHLAHVHQPPPGPKRKRKDGDGGDGNRFAELAHQIYRDERADHESKELLLAVAYSLTTPRQDGESAWQVARDVLGLDRIGRWRLNELVGRDAPCYKSPVLYRHRGDDELYHRCCAPRLRPYPERPAPEPMFYMAYGDETHEAPKERPPAGEDFRNRLGVCGAETTEYVIERLPETGWHKPHWFCSRHRGEMRKAELRFREQNKLAPAPVPNWGGLLPCYFESDWVKLYRFFLGEGWEPPVYGVRADEWPVPGKDPVPPRARLRLAAVDGRLLANL